MDNIAIITARSGSKGLKDKNIKLLCQKPLMVYSIEAALNSGSFRTVMVSTDSEKYADIARNNGAEVPFLRSEETSGDKAGSWDVVTEVLSGYKRIGKRYDTVCLLQPTSPLRTADDIKDAYRFYSERNAEAVTSVCECDHPAEYMMCLDESRSLRDFREHEIDLPRQMLPVYYRLNGALFIRRISYEGESICTCSGDEYAFVMDRKSSVDIDGIEDFEYAEFLMKKAGGHL